MAPDLSDQARPGRQKWLAITVATVILLISYWSLVFGFVAAGTDDGPAPGPPIALGLALVPFVFVALALISRQPAFGGAIVAAMLLALAVGFTISGIARDAVTGLIAGFGAGGVVSLRREVTQTWQSRSWAVVGMATFTLLAIRVVPLIGLILPPIFVLPAIGAADLYIENKTEH